VLNLLPVVCPCAHEPVLELHFTVPSGYLVFAK
jgi:hypothetical protein